MEQRPLRLGDIVDDYCPRERRVTNHAIVAIVGENIRQTRCTTCEAEHPYKHGKAPRRKPTKDASSELYDQVLANATGQLVSRADGNGEAVDAEAEAESGQEAAGDATDASEDQGAGEDDRQGDGVWSGHRPLIRATLPRESQTVTPRPIPEFTMRQPGARGGQRFRQQHYGQQGAGRPDRNGNQAGGHGGHTGHGGPGGQGQGGHHRHRRRRPGNK